MPHARAASTASSSVAVLPAVPVSSEPSGSRGTCPDTCAIVSTNTTGW